MDRIVFMGTPGLAADFLHTGFASRPEVFQGIVACFTQPDRPAGRGRKLQASPVKTWALQHGIPVYQPERLNNPESEACLRDLQPDGVWVAAYGLIIPKRMLALAPFWNVHYSLLPRYRGASPLQQTILNGDPLTGVSIMQMDPGLDTGPIYGQVTCPVSPDWSTADLALALTPLAVHAIADLWQTRSQLVPSPQDARGVSPSYAPKWKPQDTYLHFSQYSAAYLQRLLLAANGHPPTWFVHKGQRINVHRAQIAAEAAPHPSHAPGTIVRCDATGLWIHTAEGIWVIDSLQFPGRKPQKAKDWVHGKHPFSTGEIIVDRTDA